jgi:hypothetical protein
MVAIQVRAILRNFNESWGVIQFLYLQSLSRSRRQEMGKEGNSSTVNKSQMNQPPTYYLALGKPPPQGGTPSVP